MYLTRHARKLKLEIEKETTGQESISRHCSQNFAEPKIDQAKKSLTGSSDFWKQLSIFKTQVGPSGLSARLFIATVRPVVKGSERVCSEIPQVWGAPQANPAGDRLADNMHRPVL